MNRVRNQRGSATVQTVVLLPVMLLVLWIALGAAMYYYGHTAALAAAQSAAAAGAAEDATEADCRQAGLGLADRIGDALGSPQVSCSIGAGSASATVTGTVLSLIPGWSPSVSATATAPRESLT